MLTVQGVILLSSAVSSAWAVTVGAVSPGQAACNSLISSFGLIKVAVPVSPDYIGSKQEYWNTRNSQYTPSCVFFPATAQDVSTAVKTIRGAKSRFAVKTAGHNPNKFFSSVDKGVLIDLGKMGNNTYNPSTTMGTFQPGQNFGDIYKYFAQYNRTVVGARLAGVGTGLALGGGLSYLSGQYGLACDSFRELEVVLPSGQIVTASPTQNPDLFFGLRGGGGNAYGIVTKYTVQTHPAGTFYAGNLIFSLSNTGDAVLEASANFVKYNQDPKAAIITTWEVFPLPSGLDQLAILFLVYDGPDPGKAFDNFTAIPNAISNTLGPKSYNDVVNLPLPGAASLSKADNIFRVLAQRVDDKTALRNAFAKWSAWCAANKGNYGLASLDFQPVPRSLTDASKASNGGNALQLPDGPWYWLNFLLQTPPILLPGQYDQIQASFKAMVESIGGAPDLPLFLNDAHVDQKPLRTFKSFGRLQAIKKKYDPDNFFANYTGGWTFD